MADPVSTQADIDASIVENKSGLVTPTTLHRILTGLNSLGTAAFLTIGGVLYLNPSAIAPGSITADKLAPGVISSGGGAIVPPRVVTGAAPAVMGILDTLLVLNGPSQVNLEKAPPVGTVHSVKQASASNTTPVILYPAAGDTIDGGSSLTFPPSAAKPALTISFTPLGWEAY